MIKYVCDLCNKEVDKIETLIVYTKSIDYCKQCETKAKKARTTMKRSINFYNSEAERQIKEAESKILKKIIKE